MGKKILVIEDELIIAENMRLMIGEMEGYDPAGIAGTIEDALTAIDHQKPDLILLDIRLGEGKSGIEFSDTLNEMQIPFLFVTSHGDQSTVSNAIKKEPLGYIIKPVNKPMLHAQLELAFSKLKPAFFYSFRSGHHDVKIQENKIIFLKSDNIYTELHTEDSRFVIRKSTKNVMEELQIKLIQVHRSYFVNPAFIREVNAVLKLSNGTELPLTRTYKPEVVRIIFGR